jgi:hypothetical protein
MNFNSLNFYNRNYELVRSLSLDNLLLKDMKDISSFDGSILYLEGKRIHKVELVSDGGRKKGGDIWKRKKSTSQLYKELRGTWGED